MKYITSDLAKRAAWTFLQAALAVYLVSDEPFTSVAVGGAIAAGFSAVKTFILSTR